MDEKLICSSCGTPYERVTDGSPDSIHADYMRQACDCRDALPVVFV